PWVALVECLARAGQKEKAEAAVKEARSRLTAEPARPALARCYEAVGQLEQAEEQHRIALPAPLDMNVFRGAAAFFLRTGQPGKAEPYLRGLLDMRNKVAAAEQAWALRSLAALLAQSGDARQFREALTLLGSVPEDNQTVEDQCARARVLATRPGRRGEAIRLLQAARRRHPIHADELFFLAQLLEREGNWNGARDVLEGLTEAQGDDPQYLAHFARALIRHGQAHAARPQVEALEKGEPNSLRTAELKARLLKASGLPRDAVAVLEGHVEKANDTLLP